MSAIGDVTYRSASNGMCPLAGLECVPGVSVYKLVADDHQFAAHGLPGKSRFYTRTIALSSGPRAALGRLRNFLAFAGASRTSTQACKANPAAYVGLSSALGLES